MSGGGKEIQALRAQLSEIAAWAEFLHDIALPDAPWRAYEQLSLAAMNLDCFLELHAAEMAPIPLRSPQPLPT
jgi:hypothetical protein